MGRILVGTDDGVHDIASKHVALRGHSVTSLVRLAGEWWAIADGHEILSHALDPIPTPEAKSDGLRANCLFPSAHGLLVGTSEARLLRLDETGLAPIAGFDRVEGRDGWYTPWGGPPDTRSMSEDAEGALYVNVHVGGIPVSRDAETFRPTIDVDADVHQVLAHPDAPGRAFAATAMGLAETVDGGTAWTFQDEGLHAPYARAVAVAGDTVLITASTGPRGGRAALYRRRVEGGPFERCQSGLPEWFDRNIDTHCLVAIGSTAAFGTEDGRVYESNDAGVTWEEAATGLPPVRCVVVERDA
jgi:hypothetical protein